MIPSRRGPMYMMSSCKLSFGICLDEHKFLVAVNYNRCDENFNIVFVLKRSLRLCICNYSTATTYS